MMRLGTVARQLRGGSSGGQPASAPAAAQPEAPAAKGDTKLDAAQRQHIFEFTTRGVTVIKPEEHNLPPEIHRTIWDNIKGESGLRLRFLVVQVRRVSVL